MTEELTDKPANLIREHGSSDARFIAKYGIPVIMTRPLVGNLHTYDEWIDIPTMEILYRIYETYLLRKLGMSGDHFRKTRHPLILVIQHFDGPNCRLKALDVAARYVDREKPEPTSSRRHPQSLKETLIDAF